MRKFAILFVIGAVLFYLSSGCRNKTSRQDDKNDSLSVAGDSSLPEPRSINNLFLDSVHIAEFISTHREFKNQSSQLWKFYKNRQYQFAWFNNDGILEQAANFMNMLINYREEGISDSSVYNKHLHHLYHTLANGMYQFDGVDSVSREVELLLSAEFFKYAQQIWGGIDEKQMKDLDWYIKRKRLPYVVMLDSMLADPSFFTEERAVYRQYGLLKSYLKNYYKL